MIHRDLTTGEAAKFVGVSRNKLIECCESGLLRSYRVPGSKCRRIRREWLREFLERHGLAVPAELQGMETIAP